MRIDEIRKSYTKISKIIKKYDPENISLGILGSHSAIPLGTSAKAAGMNTVLVAEKKRADQYVEYNKHLYDEILVLDDFKDVLKNDVQNRLRELNTIFIPNRSFAVYVGYDNIETKFNIPNYGNKWFLRFEGRNLHPNQYDIIDLVGIKRPLHFSSPYEIDRKVIIKTQQHKKPTERFFFYVSSHNEYYSQAEEFLKKGIITDKELKLATIEEFVEGVKFNANFHSYALRDVFGEFDFVGTSDRRQIEATMEEAGHIGVTARESFRPMFYEAAQKLVSTLFEKKPPGIIGPFGIQGTIRANPNTLKPEFLVFDLSFRVPGDPIIGPTSPEMRNLSLKHNRKIEDPLDLLVMEIQEAAKTRRLGEIVT